MDVVRFLMYIIIIRQSVQSPSINHGQCGISRHYNAADIPRCPLVLASDTGSRVHSDPGFSHQQTAEDEGSQQILFSSDHNNRGHLDQDD